MRMVIALTVVAALAISAATVDAASRGVSVKLKSGEAADAPIAEEVELYGASYALVIGIDNYTGGWDRLNKAVEDATTVADELQQKGFDVTLKTDLTSDQLSRTLKEFFAIKGADPNTRLLLWYAGHGQTMNGEGFLVPADAPPATDPSFLIYALPMRDFGSLVRLARSKHVLSIFDSCFSGTIFQARSGAAPTAITRKTTKPVRQFLTSGDAGQQVRDDGSFREYFIRALRGEEKADFNSDGYVTGEELSLFMGQKMTALTNAAQTPRGGKLQDVKFNQGDFVFALPGRNELQTEQLPKTPAPADGGGAQALELAFWNAIKDSSDPAMFEAYLQQFPQGTFAPLARLKLGNKSEPRVATVVPQRKPAQAPAFRQNLRQHPPRIRGAVVETLTKLLAMADTRLHTGSPVTAAVRGDSVILNFRDAQLIFGGNDEALVLGTVTLAVTSRGGETYDFEARIPERFIFQETSGKGQKPVAYFDVRAPHLSGTFSADLGALTALDLRIKDVEVTALGIEKRTAFRLTEGSLQQVFVEDARHRWGGSLKLNLTGLRGGFDPSQDGVEIGELGLTIQLDGVDLRGLQHVYAAFNPESQFQPGNNVPLILASFLRLPDWDGVGIDAVLADVTVRDDGEVKLAIEHGAATARIDGPTDFANATAELTAAGLQAQGVDWPDPIWPSQGNARVKVTRIPLRSLLVSVLGIPEPERLLNPQAGTAPPAPRIRPEDLFASAKTEVTVAELALFSGDLVIRGSGSAIIDPFAVGGMVGQAQVTTEGLARAVSLVQGQKQTSDVDVFLTYANSLEKIGVDSGVGATSGQGLLRKLSFDIGLHKNEVQTVNGVPVDRFLGEPDEIFVTRTYVVSPDIQSLNVREQPSMDAPIIDKLSPGDHVFAVSRIQTENGVWYKLPFSLPKPFIGYAFGEYLK